MVIQRHNSERRIPKSGLRSSLSFTNSHHGIGDVDIDVDAFHSEMGGVT
jgi:hypothetical protein